MGKKSNRDPLYRDTSVTQAGTQPQGSHIHEYNDITWEQGNSKDAHKDAPCYFLLYIKKGQTH